MKKIVTILWLFMAIGGFSQTPKTKTAKEAESVNHPAGSTFLTSFMQEGELYLNIPREVLETPMLFIRYDRSKAYKYMQVLWSLEGEKVLLKHPRVRSTAGTILPVRHHKALKDNVLAMFPLEKDMGKQGELCINITSLVMDNVIEWTKGFTETLVPQLSLLQGSKDFHNEVVIKTRRGMFYEGSKVSFPVFFGLAALPENPMKGRDYDYRMGFVNEDRYGIDHGEPKNSVANIARWRLEKKHKDRKLSVPVKPITFVIPPDVPKQWRPYVRAGIEEWLPAFEAAGFKDAIVVKETDSLSEWEAHSIHTSYVDWGDSKYLRGFEESGGTVSLIIDERTGEILKGDIYLGASVENVTDRYFIRCAPLDKRAQSLPFPQELTGRLFQRIAAHETGHAFGLMDSNYGEFAYPVEKISDIQWLKTMGHTPSMMSYSRENNIAQPEDSLPPELLMQKVGPMDRHQIEWGYTEFPEEMSEQQEEEALERIIGVQDSIPWFRFNQSQAEVFGPATADEVVDTNDPVESTKLALKNLERVIQLMPAAVKDQKDIRRLENLYGRVLEQWKDHMLHVTSLLGGYDIRYKPINTPGKIFTPIPLAMQEEAMDFLHANALNPPGWLVAPEFLPKLEYSTFPDKMVEFQQRSVDELLRPRRLKRFEYMETLEGFEGTFEWYLSELQKGLFRELYEGSPKVGRIRQEIQSYYIDRAIMAVQQKAQYNYAEMKAYDYTAYSKGLLMEQLVELREDIKSKLKKEKDSDARGHWEHCLSRLDLL